MATTTEKTPLLGDAPSATPNSTAPPELPRLGSIRLSGSLASKSKRATFSRWRGDSSMDGAGGYGKKPGKRRRELLCFQVSLLVLLVLDIASLVAVTCVSLGIAQFQAADWLVDLSNVQWRFWGLPMQLTLLKIVLFAVCMSRADVRFFRWLTYLVCAGFLVVLGIDSFQLDGFTQDEDVIFRLVGANIANSLPLIFTVLEVANLNYLQGSLQPPAPADNLDVAPSPPTPQGISFTKLMYILKPYFWPRGVNNKLRACLTYVILIISKLANLVAPLFMALATNSLLAGNTRQAIVEIAMFSGLTLVSKVFKECQSLIYLKVKQTAYIELATLTYEHVHSLSYDWHVQKKLGDVLRSMDRGVDSANQVISYVFLYLFPTLAESAVVVVIFTVHYQLASLSYVAFASLVIYAFATIKITMWRKKYREATTKHDNEFHDKATDALINYETVKYFSNERYEVKQFTKVVEKYQQYSVSVQASLSVLNSAQAFVIQATIFLGLAIAAPRVIQGASGRVIDIGDFIAISVYLSNLFAPLFFLGTIYNMVINSVVDMRKLSELLSVEPDVVDVPNARDLVISPQGVASGIEIQFDHVFFHYPSQPEDTGVKDLTFTIERGTSAAFVGETGAGKTTISRLLFRFYECSSGRILIDHQDIRHVKQHSLRQSIGIVPQDTVLFNDTILSNIKYGRLNATFDEVVAAAKYARIYDFIMALPEQWNTSVGERGLKLSGGEKQRVAIARLLLKDPPFVIFDEATSALDTVTEREIQATLNRLRSNRTMMVIAHRLSTIRNADQILVLQNGTIAERGRHEELIEQHGVYARMWSAQQKSTTEAIETAEEQA